MKTTSDLKEKILELKKRKNAVILAHYYQEEAIQEIADFVGDSLELSRKASQVDADIIVFAGVYFMAETAKIVNPNKKVIVPDVKAGCSLADGCPPKEFKAFLDERISEKDYKLVIFDGLGARRKGIKLTFTMKSKLFSKYKIKKQWKKFLLNCAKDKSYQ